MARQKGMLNLSGNIEVNAGAPFDARDIVPTKADLTVASNFPYAYIGMETYVVAENKKYRYMGGGVTTLSNWVEVGSGGGTEVVANPPGESSVNLDSIGIDGVKYLIPSGGGGSGVRDYFNRIPAMTGATSPRGVASASAQVSDCQAWECMNGSPSDAAHHRWAGAYSSGAYIQYQFVTATIINRLNIIPGGASNEPVEATSVTLQASNDGTTFTDFGTWDIAVDDYNKPFLRTFNNTTAYLYYRLTFNARTWRVNNIDYVGLRQYQLDTGYLV